jgi:hypothetical protein
MEFDRVIDRLVAFGDGPFVLLAAPRRFLPPRSEESLRRRQTCFLALDEAVVLEDDGPFTATATAARALKTFRQQVVPEKTSRAKMEFFPTPAGATWGQVRLRLVDGHTVSATVGGARGVQLCAAGHG